MNREQLLQAIRKIVGQKLEICDAYVKKTGGKPTIGNDEIQYRKMTRKYLYVSCNVTYKWNEDETECKAVFHRHRYWEISGQNVDKIEWEQMFTEDLQTIYEDLVFYLSWQKCYHLPELEKAYKESLRCAKLYDSVNEC